MKFIVLLFVCISVISFAQPSNYHLSENENLLSDNVYDIAADSDGSVWFGTENGVVCYDGANMKAVNKIGRYDITGLPFKHVEVNDSILVLLSYKSLYIYNLHLGEASKYALPQDNYSSMTLSGDDIVLTNNDTLLKTDISKGRLTFSFAPDRFISAGVVSGKLTMTVQNQQQTELVYTHINDTLVDVLKGVKAVDYNSGFYVTDTDSVVSNKGVAFAKINAQLPTRNFICNSKEWALTFSENTLWFINLIKNIEESVSFDKNINAVTTDKHDNIWVATGGDGVYMFPKNSFIAGKVQSRFVKATYDSKRNVTYLINDGNIYVKNESGKLIGSNILVRFNEKVGSAENIYLTDKGGLLVSVSNKSIYNINIEAGTYSLLHNFDHEIVALSKKDDEIICISHDQIAAIVKSDSIVVGEIPFAYDATDVGDAVWIATVRGIYIYEKSSKTVKSFEADKGFSFGKITSICNVAGGNIWFSNDHSIFQFNNENDKIHSYSSYVRHGRIAPQSLFVLGVSVFFKNEDTQLGLSISELEDDKQHLTDFYVVDAKFYDGFVENNMAEVKSINRRKNGYISDLHVAYTNTSTSFLFNGFDFSGQMPFKMRYKLEGYDSKWYWADDQNTVNYSNISGGEYILMSEIVDMTGNVVATGKPLSYIVEYPFWETWAFIITTSVILGLVIYFAYNSRISRIVRVRNLLEKQVEQRTVEIEEKTAQIRSQKEILLEQRDRANKQKSEISNQKAQLEKQQGQLEKYAEAQKQALRRAEMLNKDIEKQKDYFESIYHLVAESTSDVVFRLKLPEEQFEFISPSFTELSGYTPEDVYDSKGVFWKMFAPDYKDQALILRQNVKMGEVKPLCEFKIITKTGEEKWIQLKNLLVKDELSNPVALEGLISDITRKKQDENSTKAAKHRAKEADVLKSDFYENVSCEVRSPMSTLIGFADLLADPEISLDERQGYLEHINESSNALLLLIDDLIDYSKIEANQVGINKSQCYVNNIVKDVYEAFDNVRIKNGLDDINLEYSLGISEDSFAILTDTFRLKQILTKLVGNAFMFTKTGSIEIGYKLEKEDESQMLVFYVKDSGKGIKPEMLSTIFDRYSNIDNRFEFGNKQSDLGLSLAKALVNLLGGKIWVESKVDEGSTFWFSLPFEKQKGLKNKTVQGEKAYVEDWANRTFLVAEDEDNNFRFIKAALKKTGVRLLRAKDGEQAVQFFKDERNKIDLVLMDIQMPNMNGYEATQLIKEIDKNIPIIAQTAFAMSGGKVKCFEAGCDGYISKPYKAKDILATINKHLEY